MRHIFMLMILIVSSRLWAAQDNDEQSNIIVGQWHFAASVGLGQAKNPLNGGDDIPLLLIPDIAYYADQFYFDNGQLGYTFINTEKHVASLISELNPEQRFFVFWHPKNIFQNALTSSEDYGNTITPIKIEEVNSRKWALESGINYQYFNDNIIVRFNLLKDITHVHKGWRSGFEFEKKFYTEHLIIQPIIGLWYKSKELNDYYYGLTKEETGNKAFRVGGGFQAYAQLQVTWPLSKSKAIIIKGSFDDYSHTSDSPLFKQSYAYSAFIGLKYIF